MRRLRGCVRCVPRSCCDAPTWWDASPAIGLGRSVSPQDQGWSTAATPKSVCAAAVGWRGRARRTAWHGYICQARAPSAPLTGESALPPLPLTLTTGEIGSTPFVSSANKPPRSVCQRLRDSRHDGASTSGVSHCGHHPRRNRCRCWEARRQRRTSGGRPTVAWSPHRPSNSRLSVAAQALQRPSFSPRRRE